MKPKYSAKIYFEDGKVAKAFGNDINDLILWMRNESRAKFNDIAGEIIDNKNHRIVKTFQFSPFDE
ncbi:Uncharacterised protein (plasmid) [Legionella adelaidensis]|uniref:Uncharacterized protein n=1 Tax=Legionella adelaidensis TaxID=45056 RepID=A0A0W0R097_9GAMM|nr:hypothetical protein [Legionella adelaidensis]KTC64487.1 hypothetical protein Lade_1781 [Legionella adelaidensis]VEH85855.1 Uncharacterised protein [Legionella adelaidensis]